MYQRIFIAALLSVIGFLSDNAHATLIVNASSDGKALVGSTLVNFDNLQLGNSAVTTSGMSLSFSNSTGGIVTGGNVGPAGSPGPAGSSNAVVGF